MDNISHSLAGLALAELVDRSLAPEPDPGRARTRHRLLLVSCWVASNFPDLDLVLTPLAPQPLGYLLQHRGHTHTLAGLLPQAVLLLALLWLWPAARALLRESRATPGATVGLVAAGLALHLAMDYLNVYGVHPFFPFDARWLYGDMVFIVEPVFWIVLGAPLAVLAVPGTARRVALALLVALPVLFTALGFLQWGSLAGLALAGTTLAWLQWRSGARGRSALGLGLALAALFVASQGLAVRSARWWPPSPDRASWWTRRCRRFRPTRFAGRSWRWSWTGRPASCGCGAG
ncbi:metal-dependent hydrolase [Massilia solisilvae]|uniref:Metal-dependent hydrolase n=1 Tax=Massilia solisilvae TaxID=1811225 RepID=A0ABT2BGN9_9BURK|nr:metal-dependent hydrolase [Massilia solisilvae]MCS0607694.1 metal-dependent hydrolase [Massilia solisilvae]